MSRLLSSVYSLGGASTVILSHANSAKFILQLLITFHACTLVLSAKPHDNTLHHLSYISQFKVHYESV